MAPFFMPHQLNRGFLALAALALCIGSAKAMAPLKPNPNATQDEFLAAHNQARAEVGVSPLQWSQKLAANAIQLVRVQRDKKGCEFADLASSKYGANQSWGSGSVVTPGMAVGSWVAEKKFYSHSNNSCQPSHDCGVYEQVVWKKSLELGCAQARCVKGEVTLTICFYFPPGNVVGESPY